MCYIEKYNLLIFSKTDNDINYLKEIYIRI